MNLAGARCVFYTGGEQLPCNWKRGKCHPCLAVDTAPSVRGGSPRPRKRGGGSPCGNFSFHPFFFFFLLYFWARHCLGHADHEDPLWRRGWRKGTCTDPGRRGSKLLAKTLLCFSIVLWSCLTPNCVIVRTAPRCIRRQYILLLGCWFPSWPVRYRKSFDSKQLFPNELY